MSSGDLKKAYSKWQSEKLLPLIKRFGLRKERFRTTSGLEHPDVYLPQNIDGMSDAQCRAYLNDIGFPGKYPFTRGVQASMYRGKLWTMRQYAGFGTAFEANKRYHYLLKQGTTGLSVAFDLPTQMGRDSDHVLASGEVGRVGVAIDSLDDMEVLLEGIPLAEVSTSMTINATAHILLALYLTVAKKRGVAWSDVRGTIQNDVLKEYIARGTYIYPPSPALKIVTDVFEFCKNEVPQWNTISISGYHIREAGSTAVQELGFTIADAIAYVDAAVGRGLKVDDFAPRLAFFFNCHNDFLEEIAKFRAARRIWARIMKERFGAKSERSCMLRFHTQTAGSSLTAQQPYVNVVRTTMQALAAVMGGTQSLHTNSLDEALSLPSEDAARLALRTQQVISCESGLDGVIDPFAGSYAVEALTDSLEQGASEIVEHIDSIGGMVSAIEAGYPQSEIERSAYEYQLAVEKGERQVVGVNSFEEGGAAVPDAGRSLVQNQTAEREQVERVRACRASRDSKVFSKAMSELSSSVAQGVNIMPAVCAAIEARATIGEVSDVLRRAYGEYSGA